MVQLPATTLQEVLHNKTQQPTVLTTRSYSTRLQIQAYPLSLFTVICKARFHQPSMIITCTNTTITAHSQTEQHNNINIGIHQGNIASLRLVTSNSTPENHINQMRVNTGGYLNMGQRYSISNNTQNTDVTPVYQYNNVILVSWSTRQNSAWDPANRFQHTLVMLKSQVPNFTKTCF